MDLLNPNAKYELLANNVPRVNFATGGLLQNSPIICGGQDCVVIGQPEMEMKTIEKRSYAASVGLDQNTLWIVGGWNGHLNDLRSTEFIKLGLTFSQRTRFAIYLRLGREARAARRPTAKKWQ